MALGDAGAGAAAAPVAQTARAPISTIVGTGAGRDLDEALASSNAPISVRIAASGRRPVVVFPGQAPVKGRWNPSKRVLRVTVRRPLTGTTRVARVLYVVRVRFTKTRTRAEGRLKIRARGYGGLSAVTAVRTAKPS